MSSTERSRLIEFLRGELVGPIRESGATPGRPSYEVKESGGHVHHPSPEAFNARLYWKPEGPESESQEILSFKGATNPFTSYGVGVLHPAGVEDDGAEPELNSEEAEAIGAETIVEMNSEELTETDEPATDDIDLEISNPDANKPSTMAVTFRVRMGTGSRLLIRMPRERRFFWQDASQEPFALNGRYERFSLIVPVQGRSPRSISSWRRMAAVAMDATVPFAVEEFAELPQPKAIPLAANPPAGFRLDIQVYPRKLLDDSWLITAVLRNASTQGSRELALFQSYFEVAVDQGEFLPYPESERPFQELDDDEQSMQLLYRNSHCWAIGHNCAAGWDAEEGKSPQAIYADVFPAVELSSMTADVQINGADLSIGMQDLARLPEDPAEVAPGPCSI